MYLHNRMIQSAEKSGIAEQVDRILGFHRKIIIAKLERAASLGVALILYSASKKCPYLHPFWNGVLIQKRQIAESGIWQIYRELWYVTHTKILRSNIHSDTKKPIRSRPVGMLPDKDCNLLALLRATMFIFDFMPVVVNLCPDTVMWLYGQIGWLFGALVVNYIPSKSECVPVRSSNNSLSVCLYISNQSGEIWHSR